MKSTKIIYWIVTGLFTAFMAFSAIPDLLSTTDALTFMTHLGYPKYIVPFLGVAKILGVVAILVPGYPRIKEWAYAGFAFDLLGALYSILSLKEPGLGWIFMLVPIILLIASYYLYHKKIKQNSSNFQN